MVTRLEDKLYKQQHKGKSFIDFEKNELLKGLQYIDPLHKAIIKKKTLDIRYKSFKARETGSIIFYPYMLKEYRNRWFILGAKKQGLNTLLLALDRIEGMQDSSEKYIKAGFDVNTWFDDVIGVTKSPNQKPQLIVMKIHREHAPYIITKPLHPSQKILKEEPDGTIFSISVILNYELEREILGFGECLKVLSPSRLRRVIVHRLKKGLHQYSQPEE